MPKVTKKSSFGGTWLIEPIPFVRPSNSTPKTTGPGLSVQPAASLRGEDVKAYYESIVGINESNEEIIATKEPKSKSPVKKKKSKAKEGSSKVKTEKSDFETSCVVDYFELRNALFKAAAHGQEKDVLMAIQRGVDVDCLDQFGWTALMCAAHAGYYTVVKCLLKHGANASVRNPRGNSAWDLALLAKRSKVLHLLTHYGSGCSDNDIGDAGNNTECYKNTDFTCEICHEEVKGISREEHASSVVHQLNMGHSVRDTSFGIPGHNRGFQLMLKSGWDQDKGLGPSGSGQKYPVKTHLKRDRKGLGVKNAKAKARVTHFNAFDSTSIEHKHRREREATLNKRQASKKEKREKEIERKFRMEFWTE